MKCAIMRRVNVIIWNFATAFDVTEKTGTDVAREETSFWAIVLLSVRIVTDFAISSPDVSGE